tara:strand:+ start:217 stop:606 length:390 start_codon:yes stop_codon:yes gene_type:complete
MAENENIGIALCDKWDEQKYGVNSAESSNMKLIEYLKTKYLIHFTFDSYEEYNMEYIYNNRFNLFPEEDSFRFILIKKVYYFKDRCFALRHQGIVKFQRLWKRYYSDKLKRCKNIRRLMMRQITGRKIQ